MKQIATVKSQELLALSVDAVLKRPEFKGLHAASVELIYRPEEKDVTAIVVLFDTPKAAMEYLQPKTEADQPAAQEST